jgi:hypothetical protein
VSIEKEKEISRKDAKLAKPEWTLRAQTAACDPQGCGEHHIVSGTRLVREILSACRTPHTRMASTVGAEPTMCSTTLKYWSPSELLSIDSFRPAHITAQQLKEIE